MRITFIRGIPVCTSRGEKGGGGNGGVLPEQFWGCAARFPKPLPYSWLTSAIFATLVLTWKSNFFSNTYPVQESSAKTIPYGGVPPAVARYIFSKLAFWILKQNLTISANSFTITDQLDGFHPLWRSGWENFARSRNQSDCWICWIPPAHALKKR